ncbi:MAG: 4-(cytidine 5'-diphospho)-2-C-methyl-D-erythritol kinase [Flavobacteriales bacterium]|nr:4-(cytidine 5'-diphospho)-2-C-methyl-D-erythritol kinase [Flavobacteriales bacterium]
MILFPNAKINVGLHIKSKRADGYHELETIFYPVNYCDVLEILPSDEITFSSSGIDIPGDGNLCLDAYHLLKQDFNIPAVHIHLHKIIPIGAGLGGGSSDAAFTLKGLNELFDLQLSREQLRMYAVQIGADCPFFIENKPMLATGIGEVLLSIDLDLSAYHIAIVSPNIHVSTAEVYSEVIPKEPIYSLKNLIKSSIKEWQFQNDFEQSVFAKHPAIKDLKNLLYKQGAVYAAMSGSGSSVFGLFENKPSLNLIHQYDVVYIKKAR